MSLASNWHVYKTTGAFLGTDIGIRRIQQQVAPGSAFSAQVSVLVGSGSLFLHLDPNASAVSTPATANLVWYAASQTGALAARIRTAMRVNAQPTAGEGYAGILCLQQTSNFSSAGGHAYGLQWRGSSTQTGRDLMLVKFVSGFSGTTSVLAQGAFSADVGLSFITRLTWTALASSVTLVAEAGFGVSTTALSALYSVVDTTAPFVSTVAEGVYAYLSTVAVFDGNFDATVFSSPPYTSA